MFVFIFIVWIILNSRITLEIVLLGLVLTALVYLFANRFLGFTFKTELRIFKKAGLFLHYCGVLFIEVVKAAVHMMVIVLNKKKIVHQTIVYFDVDLKTDFAKMMLANSITLTPGTITVSVDGKQFTVHCIDKSMIDGITNSRFVQLLHKMEV